MHILCPVQSGPSFQSETISIHIRQKQAMPLIVSQQAKIKVAELAQMPRPMGCNKIFPGNVVTLIAPKPSLAHLICANADYFGVHLAVVPIATF